MRLLVTEAHDIPKVYRVREVILGFFWEVSSAILDVGWVRRFHDCPRLGGTGLFFVLLCAWYVADALMVAVWLRYDVLLCVICGWAGIYIQFTIKVSTWQVGILEWMRPLVILHGAHRAPPLQTASKGVDE